MCLRRASPLTLMIVLGLLLSACGGGSKNDDTQAVTILQGQLIDSPVQGVRYQASPSGKTGLTDANGMFSYVDGDIVSFLIGDIKLGSAAAKAVLTPIDLVSGAVNELNPQVTNILRFLQSLDSNADPADGIQISEAMQTALAGQMLDFSLSDAGFESAFNALNGAVFGTGLNLVSAADAQAHIRIYLASLAGTGGSTGGGETTALGSIAISGADVAIIGASFDPDTVTPLFTESTVSVSWMGGNTNAGNVSRLSGLSISTINGAISLLQYDLQDYRSTPALSYSYKISCWSVVEADCARIRLDTVKKRLELQDVELKNWSSAIFNNNAVGPIKLNGALYWN